MASMAAPSRTIPIGEIEIEYVTPQAAGASFSPPIGNFSAHITNVPGCVASGSTEQEAFDNVLLALQSHLSPL